MTHSSEDKLILQSAVKPAIITLVCALCVAIFVSVIPANAQADVRKSDIVLEESVEERDLPVVDCPDISAERAYVLSQDGTVYFERNSEDPCKIASITKIMTAVVALETVPSDFVITVSPTAAEVGESSAELEEGDSMPLSEALKALMVPSGNDAAQAIAECVGAEILGDASDPAACASAFVDAMNAKATEIGMTDTLFINAHGLDDDGYEGDHHSTAKDVAALSAYAMAIEDFRSLTANETATCTVTREGEEKALELKSTDELLGNYTGACGIKTGFTDLAGGCFAGACYWEDEDLYAVVLHSSDEAQRFVDTRVLWDWVYNHRVEYKFANSTETVKDERSGKQVPLIAKVALLSWTDKTVDATFEDPDASITIFSLQGNVSQSVEYEEIEGAVNAGDKVGTVTFKQRNEEIAKADLVATQTIEEPTVFQKIGIWFKRLFSHFTGSQVVAESQFLNETELINDRGSAE